MRFLRPVSPTGSDDYAPARPAGKLVFRRNEPGSNRQVQRRQRLAFMAGIACASIALLVMAFANQGWMIFAIMPVFTLVGIGNPAFQTLATRQVESDRQGELQGVLASTVSLASIIAPLGFSSLYFVTRENWPGGIWLSVIALYAIAMPLVFISTRTAGTLRTENAW